MIICIIHGVSSSYRIAKAFREFAAGGEPLRPDLKVLRHPQKIYPIVHSLNEDGILTAKEGIERGRRIVHYNVDPAWLLGRSPEKSREITIVREKPDGSIEVTSKMISDVEFEVFCEVLRAVKESSPNIQKVIKYINHLSELSPQIARLYFAFLLELFRTYLWLETHPNEKYEQFLKRYDLIDFEKMADILESKELISPYFDPFYEWIYIIRSTALAELGVGIPLYKT